MLYNDSNIIQTQGRGEILKHQAYYSQTFDSENILSGFTNYWKLNKIVWYYEKRYVVCFSTTILCDEEASSIHGKRHKR